MPSIKYILPTLVLSMVLLLPLTTYAAPTVSFTPSRTSGVAPLLVVFDASGTTDSEVTSYPFHELEYTWNFGDDDTPTWSNGAQPGVHKKNRERGPVAGHVFETPGSYNVTLNVYNGTNTSTQNVTITVTDPNTIFAGANTFCFSNTSDFTGCPSGAQQFVTTAFDSAIKTHLRTNTRLLFKKGDTFTSSTPGTITTAGPATIGAFGSGALPLISETVTAVNIISVISSVVSDLRIMDLQMTSPSMSIAGPALVIGANVSDILMLRVNLREHRGNTTTGVNKVTGFGIVDTTFSNMYSNGFFGRVTYGAFLGNNWGPIVPASTGEHVLRIQQGLSTVVAHNTLFSANDTKAVLTIRGNEWISPADDTKYVNVYDNKLIGATNGMKNGWMFQMAPSSHSQKQFIHDVIADSNHVITGSMGSNVGIITEGSRITMRNNIIDVTGGVGHIGIFVAYESSVGSPIPDSNWIYNNSIYSADTTNNFFAIYLDKAITNTTVKNNVAYAPLDSRHQFLYSSSAVTGTVASNNSTDAQVGTINPFNSSSFTSPSNFRLSSGSYAVGVGVQLQSVIKDFFGVLRGGTNDMGAIQFSSYVPPTPTPTA